MIDNAYDIIIDILKPVIESQNFKRQGDEYVFVNDKHAFRIQHDDEKHVFNLDMSDLVRDGESEFYNISSYLFDDNSDERDAKSVGGDFLDSLNNSLGIQKSVSLRRKDVQLPSKHKGESTPGIDLLCGRFLTLFPQYKDLYRDDVAKYNGFLPDNFFTKTAAVVLRDTLKNNEVKQFNKIVGMLDEYYVDGDYEVQSTITYSIIGEAFRNEPQLFDKFVAKLTDSGNGTHIIEPAKCMMKYVISKEK